MTKVIFLFSAFPLQCYNPAGVSCFCHYDLEHRANIYNCSSTNLNTLSQYVPNYTDWVCFENNKIQNLRGNAQYMTKIEFLNLKNNMISSLPDSFILTLNQSTKLKWLNLGDNELVNFPLNVKYLSHLETIWLSGNHFHCDCEMTWMIGWLNNFTTHSGKHIIYDYQEIKCYSGLMVGKPIYKLNEVEMGCFPAKLTLWQKVGIGLGSGISNLIIITLVIWMLKKSREFKFFMYYYLKLDTVPKDDKDENVDNMEYDAFFCYR